MKFSLKEDCAAAMLRIATDKSINGHSLAIVPREDHKEGFIDAKLDDEQDGTYWDKVQKVTLEASIRSSVGALSSFFAVTDVLVGSVKQAVVFTMRSEGRSTSLAMHTSLYACILHVQTALLRLRNRFRWSFCRSLDFAATLSIDLHFVSSIRRTNPISDQPSPYVRKLHQKYTASSRRH